MLWNTAAAYHPEHAVFQRAVEERMPLFEAGLKGVRELALFFSEGQVRYGTITLEPGLKLFQDLAVKMEKMGVSGITILPAVAAADVRGFIAALCANGDEILRQGLQVFLTRAGVNNIRENKVKIGIISEGKGAAGATAAGTSAGVEAGTRRGVSRPSSASFRTFELGVSESPGAGEAADDGANVGGGAGEDRTGRRIFHGFVSNVLETLEDRKTTAAQAAEYISAHYEKLVAEKVEEVRIEGERQVRRLGLVKDAVLRELEAHHLAAIVCDTDLNVLACNESGGKILGGAKAIGRGTPLEQFIRSSQERQVIEIDGAPRVAHKILSVEPGTREGAVLISFE